jgi:AraC-like DNA-binding protein
MRMGSYHYEQTRPLPVLAASIECYWRLFMPTSPPPDEILSAEGRAEILFQFEGESQAISPFSDTPFACTSSWMVRPYAHALRAYQVGVSASAMVGVRFTPGGWAAFQGDTRANEDASPLLLLSDFYPPADVRRLEQQLYDKLYTPEWTTPLNAFFLRRMSIPHQADCVAYAVQQLRQREVSIAALAYQVNLSERQFNRVFRDVVGLPPKPFARVARIQRVLYSSRNADHALTLEQMAARHGYHDAAHLAHEFRALVGMTPSDYFAGTHALIAQKNPQDDRFLQSPDATVGMSTVIRSIPA